MKYGAHISTAAPFSEAINRAKEIGCECMQIFVNPPQRWYPVAIPQKEEEKFLEFSKIANIQPIISHSIYLISLSGNNPFYYESSIRSLVDELNKGQRLNLYGVNTHLGSSKDKSFEEVKNYVADGIKQILEATPEGPYFIIENSAGAGNIIGDTIDEIGQIVSLVSSPRVKVLIDTAHAFESGYQINEKNGLEEFVAEFEAKIGLDRLAGLHLNDSATPCNSKRDRHADIGKGEMGISAFERIINHRAFNSLFGIIETPSLKGKGDIDNLEILRSLDQKTSNN